jgi:hypothetical protein
MTDLSIRVMPSSILKLKFVDAIKTADGTVQCFGLRPRTMLSVSNADFDSMNF